MRVSRGYMSDSGLHPSPRHTRYSSFRPLGFSHFTTGRLTTPYPERLTRLRRAPPRQATIARLPILYSPPILIGAFRLVPFLSKCSREMRSVSVIDDRAVIERVLRHLGLWEQGVCVFPSRAPPEPATNGSTYKRVNLRFIQFVIYPSTEKSFHTSGSDRDCP